MEDFLFRGKLEEIDPAVNELIDLEAERQYRKLILIPSESTAPLAVREALGSAFQNLYAEGYPDEESRCVTKKRFWIMPRAWPTTAATLIPVTIKALNMRMPLKHWPGGAAQKPSPRPIIPPAVFMSTSSRSPARLPTTRYIRLDQSRRYDHGHEPAARRSPDAWLLGQPFRQAI